MLTTYKQKQKHFTISLKLKHSETAYIAVSFFTVNTFLHLLNLILHFSFDIMLLHISPTSKMNAVYDYCNITKTALCKQSKSVTANSN